MTEKFDSTTKEWIQTIINFLIHEWNINVDVVWTEDVKYFNNYAIPKYRMGKTDSGGAIKKFGIICINPLAHINMPRSELMNTIVHELNHLRFPEAKEKQILTLSNMLVRIK